MIDLSVHEVGLFNKLGTEQYGLAGQIKTRATNFGPPPGGIWQCRDGLLDIGAHSDHQWDIFVDLLGRPDVLADPIYRDRVDARPAVRPADRHHRRPAGHAERPGVRAWPARQPACRVR